MHRACDAFACGWGVLIFAALAMSWPVAVLLEDSGGRAGLGPGDVRENRVLADSGAPPPPVAGDTVAGHGPALDLDRSGGSDPALLSREKRTNGAARSAASPDHARPSAFLWFPWWWGVGNLLVFCCWSVAKPNYYVPCVPGMALLIGAAWVELARVGRRPENRGQSIAARSLLQAQWVLFFVAAVVAPIVVRDQVEADRWPWCLVIGLVIAIAVAASARSWRRGGSSIALAPLTAACVVGFLVAYGRIAPQENAARGHRTVAAEARQDRFGHSSTPTLMFFNEIDEGLWFYAKGFRTGTGAGNSSPL